MSDYLSVPNWSEFQHYKRRNPPWIKLHNRLADDYTFASLPDAAKGHLVMIWLLASRMDNRIPADAAWIAQRISAVEPVDIQALVAAGFLVEQVASKPLAQGEQVAERDASDLSLSDRGETEERERRDRDRGERASARVCVDSDPESKARSALATAENERGWPRWVGVILREYLNARVEVAHASGEFRGPPGTPSGWCRLAGMVQRAGEPVARSALDELIADEYQKLGGALERAATAAKRSGAVDEDWMSKVDLDDGEAA